MFRRKLPGLRQQCFVHNDLPAGKPGCIKGKADRDLSGSSLHRELFGRFHTQCGHRSILTDQHEFAVYHIGFTDFAAAVGHGVSNDRLRCGVGIVRSAHRVGGFRSYAELVIHDAAKGCGLAVFGHVEGHRRHHKRFRAFGFHLLKLVAADGQGLLRIVRVSFAKPYTIGSRSARCKLLNHRIRNDIRIRGVAGESPICTVRILAVRTAFRVKYTVFIRKEIMRLIRFGVGQLPRDIGKRLSCALQRLGEV